LLRAQTILPFMFPLVTRMTGTHYHAQSLVEIGSHKLSRLAWNHDPPNLHLLSKWDYSCESLNLAATHILNDRKVKTLLLK
jgi:hypothetical protein